MGTGIYESDTLYLAIDAALGVDFTTPWHETRHHDMGAMQLWWSGADATDGKFIVQFSLDKDHWVDSVDSADAATVFATASGAYYDFPDITCNYWRIKYLHGTITTGTVTIISSIKRRR